MKNLAGQPTFAGEVERHRNLLVEWNRLTAEDKHAVKPPPKNQRNKTQQKKNRK